MAKKAAAVVATAPVEVKPWNRETFHKESLITLLPRIAKESKEKQTDTFLRIVTGKYAETDAAPMTGSYIEILAGVVTYVTIHPLYHRQERIKSFSWA